MTTIKRYTKSQNSSSNNSGNNTAPKGSKENPYTPEEYDAIPLGEWKGGYVEGLGYVEPEVVIDGSHTSDMASDSYSDSHSEEKSQPTDQPENPNEPSNEPNNQTPSDGSGSEGNEDPENGENTRENEGGNTGGGDSHSGGWYNVGTGKDTNTNTVVFSLPSTIPTGYPAAAMAGFVYHDSDEATYSKNLGSWEVDINEKTRMRDFGIAFDIPIVGFKSELFVTKDNQGNIVGYALAFAGTDTDLLGFLIDGINDVENFAGQPSAQYMEVFLLASKIDDIVGDKELTFIGHSLGGGLAALASMITGRTAITFNPATVSFTYVEFLRMQGIYHGTSNIYGYVMENDFLTSLQDLLGIYSQGNLVQVENRTGGNPHSIITMMESLK